MKGMNKYSDKEKRAMRRRNHIAHVLADKKFRQRIRESKKRDYDIDYGDDNER